MSRMAIDVSNLKEGGMDTRAPLWWGNLWMLVVETMSFAILIVSYFYIRMNFKEFPPPRVDREPILYQTAPALGLATLNLILLLASIIPTIVLDRAARRKDQRTVKAGLIICMLFCIASIVLRFYEFPAIYFRWDDNAYGSVVWWILGMHLLHLLVGTGEFLFLATFAFRCPLDDSHALDVTVTAVYWYWVVGVWLFLYGLVYFGPRIL
jgi:heme/copper-type cytochrome/quinol oxidase subunit 3